jgi:O-6-methylguanine DNA methyltransferase
MASKLLEQLIDTPIGQLLAIADDNHLYLLKFADQSDLADSRSLLSKALNTEIKQGGNPIIEQLEKELHAYFAGELEEFQTPIHLLGTDFQIMAWQALQQVPYGHTASYQDIAIDINNPKATRAVGSSNAHNLLLIIIPCHRIIKADNSIGGYSAGILRKQYLLALEKGADGSVPN